MNVGDGHQIFLPLQYDGTLPAVGFGTWQVAQCETLVPVAIKAGYRHIDTARAYGNERAVGQGLADSGVRRSEIFVTTKVWHDRLRKSELRTSLSESLADLRTDYVDLLLVHWPSSQAVPLSETMAALADVKRAGLARHIGVANFNVAMLERSLELCPEPIEVLQAEYHPALNQSTLLDACRRLGVVFTAYTPLGRGRVVNDPTLVKLALAKGRTVAQVVLRWLLEQGVSCVPRSSHPGRIIENFGVFDFQLSADECRQIDALRRPDGRIVSPVFAPDWD